MTALIDGDIVVYRCAAANENNDTGIACWQADEMMQRIIDETDSSSYVCFLTGGGNFRFGIYPEYKANRRDVPKPRHHGTLREHLVRRWNAKVTDGHEADDAMGFTQTEDTIICSIDKDMLMIPGDHYNFVNKEFTTITEPYATQRLYYQAIMGDKVDNIPGYDGKMRPKVPKFLKPIIDELYTLTEEQDMYNLVQDMHHDPEHLDIYLKCLWIWRSEGDIWKHPKERVNTVE